MAHANAVMVISLIVRKEHVKSVQQTVPHVIQPQGVYLAQLASIYKTMAHVYAARVLTSIHKFLHALLVLSIARVVLVQISAQAVRLVTLFKATLRAN